MSTLSAYRHAKRWVVAYSGGLDSSVLLDVASKAASEIPVVALHVNHGLSAHAGEWASHCAREAGLRNVPFVCHEVVLTDCGEGVEAAARHARYEVFADFLKPGDLLLQAHHRDDQVETFFLRLMRGAGPAGLAGIPQSRQLGAASLGRPFLSQSRATLAAYAQTEKLNWVEDESNAQTHFDRNYLRHNVLPLLQHRWPDMSDRVLAASTLCAEAAGMQSEQAATDVAQSDRRVERIGESLDLELVRRLSCERQHSLLRYWCELLQLGVPSLSHLQQVRKQLLDEAGREDSVACVRWANAEVRGYGSRLYLMPSLPPVVAHSANEHRHSGSLPDAEDSIASNPAPVIAETSIPETNIAEAKGPITAGIYETLSFPVSGRGRLLLCLRPASGVAGSVRLKTGLSGLRVDLRQGGERCRPVGRRHSQVLKKLLQEHRLEPWLRDRVPLLYSDDCLVAVGDLWVCDGYTAAPGEKGYELVWQPVS